MDKLLYVGIVQAIFVVVFVASNTRKTLSEKILIVWLVFLALPLVSRVLSPDILDIAVPVLSDNLLFPLTFGPLLWLYAGSLTGDIQKIRWPQMLHFLPFTIVTIGQLFLDWGPSHPHGNSTVDIDVPTRLLGIMNIVLLLVYSGAVIRRLQLHGRNAIDHFSELPMHITLRWLSWITLGFIFAYLLPLLGSNLSLPLLFRTQAFAFCSFILVLSFFGLKQIRVSEGGGSAITQEEPETIKDRGDRENIRSTTKTSPLLEVNSQDGELPDHQPDISTKNKYARSGLTEERATRIARLLETYFIDEQPYLDPGLTIEKLAQRMGVSRHYLTQVINENFKKNFYQFVNGYRIEAVKQILQNPDNKTINLLEIASETGFNSKSTFNTTFKKLTGTTPSQYRKQKP